MIRGLIEQRIHSIANVICQHITLPAKSPISGYGALRDFCVIKDGTYIDIKPYIDPCLYLNSDHIKYAESRIL